MMSLQRKTIAALALSVLASACGQQDDKNEGTNSEDASALNPAVTAAAATEKHSVKVDATAMDAWIYFDLETGKVVTVADPSVDRTWDMAFRRFEIKTNGGLNGNAGVLVSLVKSPLESVNATPTSGYIADRAPGADRRTDPGYAFHVEENWFDYVMSNHTLKAKIRTHVVRTGDKHFFKVQLKGYYDDAGTPGHVSFDFATLPAVNSID